jgi:hypothetical protein
MRPRTLFIALLFFSMAAAPNGHASGKSNDSAAAFERLKTLAGEWESTGDGEHARLSYELVAGGTAVLERETAANRPAMLTLYHLDGERLLLTHYCMAGNQPRMQARSYDASTGALAFEFVDATNLASPAIGHMHSAAIRFVDSTHIDTVWQFYQNGKATMTERTTYVRVSENK